jgi:hypothetical protein
MSETFIAAAAARAADVQCLSTSGVCAGSLPASLPVDVLLSIFLQLPPRALLASLHVCRAWQQAASCDELFTSRDFGGKPPDAVYITSTDDLSDPAAFSQSQAHAIGTRPLSELWQLTIKHDIAGGKLAFPLAHFLGQHVFDEQPAGDRRRADYRLLLCFAEFCSWDADAKTAVAGGISLWPQPTDDDAAQLDPLAGRWLTSAGALLTVPAASRPRVVATRRWTAGHIVGEYVAKVRLLPGLPPGTDGWFCQTDPVWSWGAHSVRVDIINTHAGRPSPNGSVLDPEQSHPTVRLLFDATTYGSWTRWVEITDDPKAGAPNLELAFVARERSPLPAGAVRVSTVPTNAAPLRPITAQSSAEERTRPGAAEVLGPPPRLVMRATREIAPWERFVCAPVTLAVDRPQQESEFRRDLLRRRESRIGGRAQPGGGYFVFAF